MAGKSKSLFVKTAGLLIIAVIVVYLMALSAPLPSVQTPSVLLDANGRPITTNISGSLVEIPADQIPDTLKNAVVAIEDERFYSHPGIDFVGLARAVLVNIRAGRLVQGGSTITQQLAKNLYLGAERTLSRKVKEAFLTLNLEARYSKDEILERYLNIVYFGHGAVGVEAAARVYFGKHVRDLDLAESAMIAGLIRGPGYYSPYIDPVAAISRRNLVLRKMEELGYITVKEARQAKSEKLKLSGLTGHELKPAPYFVDYVMKEVAENLPEGEHLMHRGGIRVHTTLDLDLQQAAEKAFADGIARLGSPVAPDGEPLEGGLVALDPGTGAILAMIGGTDYSRSQFNRVTMAKRQPGSAMKPILYTAALERDFTAASPFVCEPVWFPEGGGYMPKDSATHPYHYRSMQLREALVISDNVVSVRLNDAVGPQNTVLYARKMGIESDLIPNLSLALGTSEVTLLELTRAYSCLANGGYRVRPYAVTRIEAEDGRVLYTARKAKIRAVDSRVAYIVTDILKGVLRPGGTAPGLGQAIARPAAGKTGTTQGAKDAWFVGYTPDIACGVYLGYDDPSHAVGISGGQSAGPIWAQFVSDATRGTKPRDFTRPEGIVSLEVCGESGMLATPYCPWTRWELFLEEKAPSQPCTWHSQPSLVMLRMGTSKAK